jgi:uncharacterized ParB-like nuclease family protein
MLKKINPDQIITDGLQARAQVNTDAVNEYADFMKAGGVFPPLSVVSDGKTYWMADGFHRLAACRKIGLKLVSCEVSTGTRVDALRMALGANQAHGLRRTNADKTNAVLMAYEHRQELGWPDVPSAGFIAEKVGVSDHFAADQLRSVRSWADATARTGSDGKTRSLPPTRPPARPPAPPVQTPPPCHEEGPDGDNSEPVRRPPPPQPPRPTTPPPVPYPPAKPPAKEKVRDEIGRVIPDHCLELWNRRQEAQDLITMASRIRTEVEGGYDDKDPLFAELNWNTTKSYVDSLYKSLTVIKPYAVCPFCQGVGCKACGSRGLVSKFYFENMCPSELREAAKAEAKRV